MGVLRERCSLVEPEGSNEPSRSPKMRKDRDGPFAFLAEREGFEPSIRRKPYNALAGRPLRPLGHLSGSLFNYYNCCDIPRQRDLHQWPQGALNRPPPIFSHSKCAWPLGHLSGSLFNYYNCCDIPAQRDPHQASDREFVLPSLRLE